jgi:hypothetical protein
MCCSQSLPLRSHPPSPSPPIEEARSCNIDVSSVEEGEPSLKVVNESDEHEEDNTNYPPIPSSPKPIEFKSVEIFMDDAENEGSTGVSLRLVNLKGSSQEVTLRFRVCSWVCRKCQKTITRTDLLVAFTTEIEGRLMCNHPRFGELYPTNVS